MEAGSWEWEEQNEIEWCCVTTTRESLKQLFVIFLGEKVKHISGLIHAEIRSVLKAFIANIVNGSSYTEYAPRKTHTAIGIAYPLKRLCSTL